MSERAMEIEKVVMVVDALRECAPPKQVPRHASWPVGGAGTYLRFPEPFNAKAIAESARVKPDLHNQFRRFSSGMTLVAGGRMKLPSKWGSGRG